jgi:hypothetical protein
MIWTSVMNSKTAIARPIEISAIRPLPKARKPVVILSGIFHSPTAMRAAAMTIGIRLTSTMPGSKPATSPPASTPSGIVIMPASTPWARKERSSFSMMPSATGIVNTIVGPIMAPRIRPASRPASASIASCCASG